MKAVSHKILGDHRGKLIAIEGKTDVPFDIKRIFYIYEAGENISRGCHSHYKTKQYLIALSGSCKVTLDDGHTKKTFHLHSRDKGLFQDALVWGEMHNFSNNCVLLVLASEHYMESDYIYDYDNFLDKVK